MVTAYAIAGDLTFNPEKDTLIGADGKEVMLDSPFGDSLPQKGFDRGEAHSSDEFPCRLEDLFLIHFWNMTWPLFVPACIMWLLRPRPLEPSVCLACSRLMTAQICFPASETLHAHMPCNHQLPDKHCSAPKMLCNSAEHAPGLQ